MFNHSVSAHKPITVQQSWLAVHDVMKLEITHGVFAMVGL